jgi:hypothetical protein
MRSKPCARGPYRQCPAPSDEEADVDGPLFDVAKRRGRLDVHRGVSRPLDAPDVELVCGLGRDDKVGPEGDRRVHVDGARLPDDRLRLRAANADSGGHPDEPVARTERADDLCRTGVEGEDPRCLSLEHGRLVAGPLHRDGIRLLERPERLRSLAAPRAREGGEQKSEGKKPG